MPDRPALYIVTGHSRGLGAALAAHWLARPGATVLGISRGRHGAVPEGANERLLEWSADLAQPGAVAVRLEAWLRERRDAFDTIVLVNNAALITPPGPLEGCSPDELAQAMRVGLEAPLVLCSAFLRATAGTPAARRILNISSGLGRRPMAGAVAYGAVKAGLDHLTRCLALEQAAAGDGGARVVSLAPGIIDTDMQVQLRSADGAAFPERERFARFHAEGQLQSGADTAARIARHLDSDIFGSEPVADIRDAG